VYLPQLRPDFHFEPEGTCDGLCSLARTSQIARIHGSDRVMGALLTEESQFLPASPRQGDIPLTLKAPVTLRRRVPYQE